MTAMRTIFVTYVVFVSLGLVYVISLGLLHR